MKNLNITKERFEKSRYFQKKYGQLKYVSESGNLFKTSKGHVIKFNEAKKSTYDGAENALEKLKLMLEQDKSDLERVAKLKEKVARFTLEAIEDRKKAKAAVSAAKAKEKETEFLDKDAKEFAEYLGGDADSLFFAVQDHANKTGLLLAKKIKVISQGEGYERILDKITDPKLIEEHPQLAEASKAMIAMLENARNMLIECGLFEEPKPEKTWSASIYDQDEEGKMHKNESIGGMVKGAWQKIKDGFSKFCNWFTETFFPKYQVKEENYLKQYDDFLTQIDQALA